MKNFENFTAFYSLPRSLRFELKPIWKTKELINDTDEIFPKDKRIDEIYQNIIKPCLNDLHSDLIENSLENISISKIPKNIVEIYKNEKDSKKFNDIKKSLREEIVSFLSSYKNFFINWYKDLLWKNATEIIIKIYWEKIYEKNNDSKNQFLFSDLLWKTYKEIIETYFLGFSTYLRNFHTNRENLYKSEWKIGSVATRVVDENFIRFLQNILVFEEKINSYNILSQRENELFLIENFDKYINQKWIDNYNKIIWDIHSKINEYNQKNNLKWNQKIPKLLLLYKQILWKSEKQDINSFVDNIIQTDNELEIDLKNFIKIASQKIDFININVFSNLWNFEMKKVFVKKSNLKIFSNLFLENYNSLEKLFPEYDDEWKIKNEEEIVSLEDINKAFSYEKSNLKDVFKKQYFEENKTWFELFLQAIKNYFDEIIKWINNNYYLLERHLLWENFIKNLKIKEKNIDLWNEVFWNPKNILKSYLDSFLQLDRLVHMFDLTKWQWKNKKTIEADFDTDFYWNIDEYMRDFSPFKFYNSIRNYLTKKPYSEEKIKLNFDYSDFLQWNSLWKYAFIYKDKEWKFYLWIVNHSYWQRKYNPEFLDKDTWFYQIDYKQLKFNTLAWKWYIRDFWVKYSEDKNAIENLKTLIKKQYLEKYPSLQEIIDFKTNSKKEFDKKVIEVMPKTYSASFVNIDKNYIDIEVEKWNIHLFQIYNKDFSDYKKEKAKDNLHTMYFKALFEKDNFKSGACFKLNSSWAEIFFREKSINEKKLKNLKVTNKWAIEKKRYTENKILLHIPITLNFISKNDLKVNDKVKEYLKKNYVNIIWIDRWEKHLLYFSLIDRNWKIMKIDSLNTLVSETPDWVKKEAKYAEKLQEKEWNRDKERKNWEEIETIKELKEGYISQVVDKIVKLAIENNAIIVMEDLNSGFKRWRQKIERQVYQKFELALAKKLNFLVDKTKDFSEIWWLYSAYQLTPKIENFQDIYAQTWIVFYTQAWYTSTTCPVCWFRKNIYKNYDNEKNFKKWFKEREVDVIYKNWDFEITYSIEQRTDKRKNKLKKLNFKLLSKNQERYRYIKSTKWKWWEIKSFNISKWFLELFKKHNIDLENITWEILDWNWEVSLYKDFLFYFNLLLQIRNSADSWDDGWYISCPSCLFHSDNWFQNFHFNWDANWAYNIARKWKIITDKIRNNEKGLGVSNVEWDNEVLN